MSPLYINGRFFAQPLTGVQRYARETLEAMDRLWPDSPLADRPATDRKSTRLNSSHSQQSRMPSSA